MTSSIAICFLTCCAVNAEETSADLLHLVVQGQKSASEAIRTFSADYSARETHPDNRIIGNGKYIRDGEVVLIRDGSIGSSTEDCLIRNGECRRVGRVWQQNGKIDFFAVRDTANHFHSFGDVWRMMLLDPVDANGKKCSVETLFDKIASGLQARREKLHGRNCVRIDFKLKDSIDNNLGITVWYDVEFNDLARRFEATYLTVRGGVDSVEIDEFREIIPGIHFPVKRHMESRRGSELLQRQESEIGNVTINSLISPDFFKLPDVPSGTRLEDMLNAKTGKMTSDWKFDGSEKEFRQMVVPGTSSANGAGITAVSQTASEPISYRVYVLWISVFVLLTAVLVSILMRRRNRIL